MAARSDTGLDSGQKFGRLTVRQLVKRPIMITVAECICECGKRIFVKPYNLRAGNTQSCGCFHRDNQRRLIRQRVTTHGHAPKGSPSPEYRTWLSMRARCENPKHAEYRHYGGRGITVCERWLVFENFFADMGRRPEGMSIDRFPNNDGNYEPDNCRWANAEQQQQNRRSSRLFTIDDETLCLAGWARRFDVPYKTLHQRIKRGWNIQEALNLTRKEETVNVG